MRLLDWAAEPPTGNRPAPGRTGGNCAKNRTWHSGHNKSRGSSPPAPPDRLQGARWPMPPAVRSQAPRPRARPALGLGQRDVAA